MRTIAVVTVARSDYGIYRPILRAIGSEPSLRLQIIVGGMHLAPEFGLTVTEIERDGFAIAERVDMLLSSDTPVGIAKSIGIGTIGFAHAFERIKPDILLVLGDRFEMYSAVVAALPFAFPIAHIHGGESTEGGIDEAIRHSITKASHLHFVSATPYRDRVVQMGEEPWRVTVSGAPSLDAIKGFTPIARDVLSETLGIDLARPTLLVTYHPVTLQPDQTEAWLNGLLDALGRSGFQTLFTYPNADANNRTVLRKVAEYVARHPGSRVVDNLGTATYFSVMAHVAAMVGNTSSGIIEAASFETPVVNVGIRQRGRIRGKNVIDVGYEAGDILAAIRKATSAPFRSSLVGMENPYGDGTAASKVVSVLRDVLIDDRLIIKRFHNLTPAPV